MKVTWGQPIKPIKIHNGHAIVRLGTTFGAFGETVRTNVECECGSRLSGKGGRGGLNSWEKHFKREQAKAAKAVTAESLGLSTRAVATDREESEPCQAGTVGCSIDHAKDHGDCETW